MPNEALERAAELIQQAEMTVALTGAGFSTPSGIPDFRSRGSGMWDKDDPMEVASYASFRRNPARFYQWVMPLAQTFMAAEPNPAHYALADLEAMGKLYSIVTQNIDLLHSRAGSQTVYEVHGSLRDATCLTCYRVFPCGPDTITDAVQAGLVPTCSACGGILKPNVILFGEQLPMRVLEAAERDIRRCDLMIAAGTSLEVYPVADLPRRALARGAKLILINYTPTAYDKMAEVVIHGDVAEALPQIFRMVNTA